jgi:photosystem II stability/assembly factor-like uncharacterized protein
MMVMKRRLGCTAAALAAAVLSHAALAAPGAAATQGAAQVGAALSRPAVQSALAPRSVLQSAARAGDRLVAVGERGIVLLSDDQGKTWRQVPVPVSVGLTAVRFADAERGWIVGHGGVVLASTDGGQTWTKQLDGVQAAKLVLEDAKAAGDPRALADAERLVADGADKPFLDALFFDARHGIIVGAYNLAFETADGGKTWQPISRRLDNPRALHLYAVRARGDEVVIAGEQGVVLRSADRARSFQRLSVPYKGSFFTAELVGERDIVIAGLRGNVWKSSDAGASWAQVNNPVPVSITASAQDAQGRLWLGNQAGMVLAYTGEAVVPTPAKLPPLTGLLPLKTAQSGDQALALSIAGAVPVTLGTPK